MPLINRSQPDKWTIPFQNTETIKLEENERLAMIMHYEVKDKTKNSTLHTMFAVIRKGDKSIAKNIINNNGKISARNMAEYPIQNENELMEEVKELGLQIGILLAEENQIFETNFEKPVFVFHTEQPKTKKEILEIFSRDKNKNGIIAKQIITETLGLNEEIKEIEKKKKIKIPKINKQKEKKEKILKKNKEKELIKKFGRKQMEELAKKIKYRGEILNKKSPKKINKK